MSSVHKKARLGFAALVVDQSISAACRYDPPQQSAALFLLLSSSPLLLLRHYSPVSARDGWPRGRQRMRVRAPKAHGNYLRVTPNPLSTFAPDRQEMTAQVPNREY